MSEVVIKRLMHIVSQIDDQLKYLDQTIKSDKEKLFRLEKEFKALSIDKEEYQKTIKELRSR